MSKGYVIAFVDVTDMNQYQAYMQHTPAIIAQYGGKFIVRGGRNEILEGEMPQLRMVAMEFPSYEAAVAFYKSDEYTAAKAVRAGAATATFIALEGLE